MRSASLPASVSVLLTPLTFIASVSRQVSPILLVGQKIKLMKFASKICEAGN